jgi:cytochrome c5
MKKIFFVLFFGSIVAVSCLNKKPEVVPVVANPITPNVVVDPNTPIIPNTSTCDTTTISFDKTIFPILQANCTACHSTASASGGIDLTNYTAIATIVKNGKLYGAITHTTGYSPMPSSSQKVSDCNIIQIKKWIVAGYPNGATVISVNPTNPVNPVVVPPVSLQPNLSTNCGTVASNASKGDSVCFNTQILPLIVSNCATSGCHDAKSRAEGYELTSFSTIIKKGIIAGNPSGSKLYQYMVRTDNERMPRPPAAPLSKTQTDLVAKWIKQGAKNVNCSVVVDTANVTFSKTIFPIIETTCIGCHRTGSVSGGVNLENYVQIKNYVDNKKLYGAISYQAGYFAMPPSGKMTDCQIGVIKKWIDAGAKND